MLFVIDIQTLCVIFYKQYSIHVLWMMMKMVANTLLHIHCHWQLMSITCSAACSMYNKRRLTHIDIKANKQPTNVSPLRENVRARCCAAPMCSKKCLFKLNCYCSCLFLFWCCHCFLNGGGGRPVAMFDVSDISCSPLSFSL